MGEAKSNRTALAAKTFPTFPPHGRKVALQTIPVVAEKLHVFVTVPGEATNEKAVNDHAEVCKQWGVEQVIHVLGEPLPPEKCDVVFCYAAAYVDTIQRRGGMVQLPGEIMRIDLVSFLASGEGVLAQQSRIVAPGMGVVP